MTSRERLLARALLMPLRCGTPDRGFSTHAKGVEIQCETESGWRISALWARAISPEPSRIRHRDLSLCFPENCNYRTVAPAVLAIVSSISAFASASDKADCRSEFVLP